jgi:hypothetical protein
MLDTPLHTISVAPECPWEPSAESMGPWGWQPEDREQTNIRGNDGESLKYTGK